MKVLNSTGYFLSDADADALIMQSRTIYKHRTPAEKEKFMFQQRIEYNSRLDVYAYTGL